jgi:hypothetical protein
MHFFYLVFHLVNPLFGQYKLLQNLMNQNGLTVLPTRLGSNKTIAFPGTRLPMIYDSMERFRSFCIAFD